MGPNLTKDEIRAGLLDVQAGRIPAYYPLRDLQAALLITYADARCVSFTLTEEGRAWLAEHGGGVNGPVPNNVIPLKVRVDPSAKIDDALDVLESCIGHRGVYADPSRYDYQCWTRDFALAVQPVLHRVPGGVAAGERHLRSLAARQEKNGKMPIVFLDGPLFGTAHFLWTKVRKSIRDGKLSFMLRRYLSGHLGDLTPGTHDSELMFLFALSQRTGEVPDDLWVAAIQAQSYVEQNLLDEDDFLIGADWRDTLEAELGNKALLSNNAVWHGLLRRRGLHARAGRLRERLLGRVEDGALCDYPGAGRFDPLGGALAVLHGVTDKQHADWLVDCFQSVDSPHGVTVRCRHNPQDAAEARVIDRTGGAVVWPFVVGFAAIALHRLGTPRARELALDQLRKLLSLDGFREWYDPADGRGYGAERQLFSAALTVRACEEISGEVR